MKLFKSLKTYKDIEEAALGFGIVRAKDYDRDKYGHLILFSIKTKVVSFFKKLFIPF